MHGQKNIKLKHNILVLTNKKIYLKMEHHIFGTFLLI